MQRIRTGLDGTFWLARSDKETEAYLDSKYVRLPNELKWVNKIPSVLGFHCNEHLGKECYIIGKGPSLDKLEKRHFTKPDSPVIAINESVHKIEKLNLLNPIYGMQMDSSLGTTCHPNKDTTKLIISNQCRALYDAAQVYKIEIDPRSLGLQTDSLSVLVAIMMARHFGCIGVDLFCFDGCVGGDYEYANCVGYSSAKGGSPLRFREHKPEIIEACKNRLQLHWLTPKEEGKLVEVDSLT